MAGKKSKLAEIKTIANDAGVEYLINAFPDEQKRKDNSSFCMRIYCKPVMSF